MKNNYEVRGDITAIFLNSNGKTLETLINTTDIPIANKFERTWYVRFDKTINGYYVLINEIINNKRTSVLLHRAIMGAEKGMHIDHINHNTLDNTRTNLREVTCFQNSQNRKGSQVNSKSGIRGVSWNNHDKLWYAVITMNKKQVYHKGFKNIIDAEKDIIEVRKRFMPFSTI